VAVKAAILLARVRSSPGVCGPRSSSSHTMASFLWGKLERAVLAVAEAVLEFGHAAAEAGLFHHEMAPRQSIDDVLYARLIERHHRIAIALLIAGVGEGIQGKRVLVRRRDLLFR
jgi:hypothetical protein